MHNLYLVQRCKRQQEQAKTVMDLIYFKNEALDI